MRKILMLLIVMMTTSVNAERKVVFSGSFALGYEDASTVKIPASSFKDIAVGDKLTMIVSSDSWCKAMLGSSWELIKEENASNGKFLFEVTEELKTNILANGLYFQGNPTVTKIYYGTDAVPTVLYTNDSGYQIESGWHNSFDEFSSYDFSDAAIGDLLTFTVECTATTDDWHPLVIRSKEDGTKYKQYNTYGQTSIVVTIDSDLLTYLNNSDITGDQFKLKGISFSHEENTYILNAEYDGVDLSTINGMDVNVDLHRHFDWNSSLCVPFDISNVSSTFGYSAKAYEFMEYNGGLNFIEREHIEAGKTYYMTFGEADKDKTSISLKNVTINTTLTNSAESGGLTFKGNYTPGMDMEGKYGVACMQINSEWVWGFYKGASGSKLNAFSAYFEGSIPAARLSIIIDEEVNGINEVQQSISSNNYYTINGMRIDKPTKKGLYILNEKKVIIK